MSDNIPDISTEQVNEDLKAGDKLHGERLVSISVNDRKQIVRSGRYIVRDFKLLIHVEPGYVLQQMIHGSLVPLKDEDKVVIKGGEIFFTHPPKGQAS